MSDKQFGSVTIPSGTATSAAVNLQNQSLVGFIMPSAWDAAALSVQVSMDGTNWKTPYDVNGNQVGLYTSPVVNGAYNLDPTQWLAWNFMRFISGTVSTPVNQTAARSITVSSRLFS